MSPADQKASQEAPLPQKGFVQRVVDEVPSLHDALTLYNTTKKERQYVGAALQVAEAGMSLVASTALPLAHPLLSYWGGWGNLDEWACQKLDCVEAAAPIITQPTQEVVSKTCALVLKTIAGQEEAALPSLPLSTLSDALAARAHNTVKVVAETQAGVAVTGAAHRLLDSANTIVDTLLPVEKWDHVVLDHDGRGGNFGMRIVVLRDKCQRRMKAKVCNVLHVAHSQPLNPDDLDITAGHLVELARRLALDWQVNLKNQVYASQVYQCVKTSGTESLNRMKVIHSYFVARAGPVWAFVMDRARKVQSIVYSSPAGPLVIAGVDVVNNITEKSMEMARNGVDIWAAVLRYNIVMVRSCVLIVDSIVRGTMKQVKNRSVCTVEQVARRGRLVVTSGVNSTRRIVTDTTQASIATVAVVFGTGQHVITFVIITGKSVGRQGINVIRNFLMANTTILLKIYTTSQKFLPGSKYLHLSSLIGKPSIWISAASCYNTQVQQQPQADTMTAISSSKSQETPNTSPKTATTTSCYNTQVQQQPQADTVTAISSSKSQETPDASPKAATTTVNCSKDLKKTTMVKKPPPGHDCSLPPPTTQPMVNPPSPSRALYSVTPWIYYKLYFMDEV